MDWSALAVGAVAVGTVLCCCGLLMPFLGGRTRLFAGLLGVSTVASGLDTADQPGGSAVYPAVALLVALAGIGYVLYRIRER